MDLHLGNLNQFIKINACKICNVPLQCIALRNKCTRIVSLLLPCFSLFGRIVCVVKASVSAQQYGPLIGTSWGGWRKKLQNGHGTHETAVKLLLCAHIYEGRFVFWRFPVKLSFIYLYFPKNVDFTYTCVWVAIASGIVTIVSFYFFFLFTHFWL